MMHGGFTRRSILAGIPLGLSVLGLPGLGDVGAATANEPDLSPQASLNAFGIHLFTQAIGGSSANSVISPLSLAIALQMVAEGADGETERAFRSVLRLGGKPTRQAGTELGALVRDLLHAQKDLVLHAANGIWVAKGVTLRAAFREAQVANFAARIESCDFTAAEALTTINRWFADQTQNMIPQMLPTLPPDLRVILANALYFKGRWEDPFRAERTEPKPFRTADRPAAAAAPISVPMMRQSGRFLYRETDAYQAIRLRFAGRIFEMIVVLPAQQLAARDWARGLTEADWSELLALVGYKYRQGELFLPRLDVTTGSDMRELLQAIGLERAFQQTADFSRMADTPIRLDQVIHRTALTWDEAGAEAAAATSAGAVATAVGPRNDSLPFRMNVDRPFLLALRHVQTGTLALVGLIRNPAARVA